MARLEERLSDMLGPSVEALGFELLGVELVRAGKHTTVRIYIDQPEKGVTVDDCADVSRQVSAVLDVEDPISYEYHLEVSSPGLDRPLFKPAHYRNALGEQVALRCRLPVDGRRKLVAILVEVNEDTIVVDAGKGSVSIAFSNIDKANLVPTFDK